MSGLAHIFRSDRVSRTREEARTEDTCATTELQPEDRSSGVLLNRAHRELGRRIQLLASDDLVRRLWKSGAVTVTVAVGLLGLDRLAFVEGEERRIWI